MKLEILFSFLMLTFAGLTSQAAAAPFPLQGNYTFKGSLDLASTTDNRVVYAFTDQGKIDLENLRAEGYACEAKPRDTYLCKKNLSGDGLPENVKAAVVARAEPLQIAFLNHAPDAPDSLENDSPDLKEWRIMQKVQIGDRYWPSYRYLILQNEVHKIALGEGDETQILYFGVSSSEALSSYINIAQSNPKGFRQYRVFAGLVR